MTAATSAPSSIGRPLAVDVVMTTYNHGRFVGRAIESVLMQEADFPIRLLVAEDLSHDDTRDVIRRYADRRPDRIAALFRERNLGATRNLIDAMRRCDARYVALLEGDDYWTCPRKLASQVAYMEANPRCAICFTDVTVFSETGEFQTRRSRPPRPGGTAGLRDLLRGNFVHTCSVLLRAGLIENPPDWYYPLVVDDWTLFVLASRHGYIGHLDQVTAAYRVHAGGVWSGQRFADQQFCRLHAYDAVNRHFRYEYDAIIRGVTARCCYEVAMGREQAGNLTAAGRFAVESLRRRPHGSLATRMQLLRVAVRAAAPGAYDRIRQLWHEVRKRLSIGSRRYH